MMSYLLKSIYFLEIPEQDGFSVKSLQINDRFVTIKKDFLLNNFNIKGDSDENITKRNRSVNG